MTGQEQTFVREWWSNIAWDFAGLKHISAKTDEERHTESYKILGKNMQ